MSEYLDKNGLAYAVSKLKTNIDSKVDKSDLDSIINTSSVLPNFSYIVSDGNTQNGSPKLFKILKSSSSAGYAKIELSGCMESSTTSSPLNIIFTYSWHTNSSGNQMRYLNAYEYSPNGDNITVKLLKSSSDDGLIVLLSSTNNFVFGMTSYGNVSVSTDVSGKTATATQAYIRTYSATSLTQFSFI